MVRDTEKRPINPRPISLTACLAKAKYQGITTATFTSFIFRHGSEDYLISAWHNFSGRRSDDLSPIAKKTPIERRIPNEIEVSIPFCARSEGESSPIFTLEFEINLYPRDLGGGALWFVHPDLGHSVDVAALSIREAITNRCRIQFFDGQWESAGQNLERMVGTDEYLKLHDGIPEAIRYEPVNRHAKSNLRAQVGDEVFIVGFPLSLTPTGMLPIWKKGSIATEPDADAFDLPLLLVDSMPREGLSGSPAIQLKPSGSVNTGKGTLALISGEAPKFLGVYTGRDHGRAEMAQLGRVWKSKAVTEICLGARRGANAASLAELEKENAHKIIT